MRPSPIEVDRNTEQEAEAPKDRRPQAQLLAEESSHNNRREKSGVKDEQPHRTGTDPAHASTLPGGWERRANARLEVHPRGHWQRISPAGGRSWVKRVSKRSTSAGHPGLTIRPAGSAVNGGSAFRRDGVALAHTHALPFSKRSFSNRPKGVEPK